MPQRRYVAPLGKGVKRAPEARKGLLSQETYPLCCRQQLFAEVAVLVSSLGIAISANPCLEGNGHPGIAILEAPDRHRHMFSGAHGSPEHGP